LPWTLVAASALLLGLVLYLLFGLYLPATKHVLRLEAELRDVYAREAALQSRLTQQDQTHSVREQQLAAYTAEREALSRKVEELEKELAALKGRRTKR
jgi:septal ring factor EnvC (AmiA/AmiB activator)